MYKREQVCEWTEGGTGSPSSCNETQFAPFYTNLVELKNGI